MKINLEHLYYEVLAQIEKVDFSKLWRGFAPLKFALYDTDSCFFDGEYIAKTDEFLGNTAISYHNEVIAIWDVSEEMDSSIMASKIIHEMFHGFQLLHNECRFPDELDALYHYSYNDCNLSLKLQENRILTELLEQFDAKKLEELLKIRKFRSTHFPYAYHYESCVEQIEGTATFVELNVLKQLSPALYLEKLNHLRKHITTKQNLVPIRIICYNIGALLLLLLHENGIPYPSDFVPTPFSESLIADAQAYTGAIELTMGEILHDYYEKANAVIAEAISKHDVVATNGVCDILGVNVYDAVYHNHHIISRYFVMYGEEEQQKVEYGNFVIETKAYKKMSKLYRM